MSEQKTQTDFLKRVAEVQDKIINAESFGDFTEFSDEDGCVLFTIRDLGKDKGIEFDFYDDSYIFLEKDIERNSNATA